MTTYNLNSVTGTNPNTDLNALLAAVKAPADASNVSAWAQAFGFKPTSTNPMTAVVESAPGNYTLPGSGELFLFSGAPGQTATITDATGGNILSDPGNITYSGPTMAGATGGDTLLGAGGSMLYAKHGDNTLISMSGNSTLIGGSGTDYLYGGMHTSSTDSLFAGSGTEDLFTFAGNNTLVGGSGTDYLGGGAGHDALYAGTGSDVLYAGTGTNTLVGGSGNDWLIGNFSSGASYDLIYSYGSATSTTTIVGGVGGSADVLLGVKNEVVGSSAWDNVLAGYSGSNSESDTIYGGAYTAVQEANASTAIATQTVVGGITQIAFNNGQTLDSWNATITFADGKVLKT